MEGTKAHLGSISWITFIKIITIIFLHKIYLQSFGKMYGNKNCKNLTLLMMDFAFCNQITVIGFTHQLSWLSAVIQNLI